MHLFNKCCVPHPCHHGHHGHHAQHFNVQQTQGFARPPYPVQQSAQFANVQQAPVQQQTLFENLPTRRSKG
ncbi:hypothetical protein Desdi_2248 [Desulfitobacterium dichloroeliminans LMG P-21439]|uniref:Uncharacterized protein n=1 Tax=Desulfitobacterium dichloroeliminans (strain LMG P-21439 / DCA1) TaxID=871963 RepID=L0F769_DESDL|nr:hypothetical protein [Desulfitobacterium dichloroeliminans]AGA69679.1 hypothetical protein Desdi_2248 [Desulfitobacterium dichloroeliminans LMG P-21439]